MKETLYDARGLDETRIRRAFGWIITFRDFPAGCRQTVDGAAMMTEALTLFTKGRAEFFLDGCRRGDRVPGTLSSEHELVGQDGMFELLYSMPTTRLCVPSSFNHNRLPSVVKLMLKQYSTVQVDGKYLVCLGSIEVNGKVVEEERTFVTTQSHRLTAISDTILLQFLD